MIIKWLLPSHCCSVCIWTGCPAISWFYQYSFITQRRSFAKFWKYFVAHFNDVHTFGYNSAGSERIWMKFRELLSILFGAGPDRFWAQSTQKRERESLWKFFLSGKQRTTLPISGQPIFTKFAHKTLESTQSHSHRGASNLTLTLHYC